MKEHIEKIIKMIDENDKIKDKLTLYSLYYEVLSTIDARSLNNCFDENLDLIEKIFEIINDKSKKVDRETIPAKKFFKTYINTVNKAPLSIHPYGEEFLDMYEQTFEDYIKNNTCVPIIDIFANLRFEDKVYTYMLYRQNYGNLLENCHLCLGNEKGQKVGDELLNTADISLFEYLRDSVNNNMSREEIINNLGGHVALTGKNYLVKTFKEDNTILEDTPLGSKLSILGEKERPIALITDIYELTGFIDDKNSEKEFIRDCCYYLNVNEETFKKDYFIKGISPLTLRKIIRLERDE